jgi:hypothetical protein
MTTIDINTVPSFYQGYVKTVQTLDVMEALTVTKSEISHRLETLPVEKLDFSYAVGKWTASELLCHVIDAERIFTYRALCFSRNDKTNLPGFDENAYVPNSNARSRSLLSIRSELENLRLSTMDFFASLSADMLSRTGVANNTEISVLTLGYVIAGHSRHHLNILNERYLK